MEESKKLFDAIFVIYLLIMAIGIPLILAPTNIFPNVLLHFKIWLNHKFECGNYQIPEEPHPSVRFTWLLLLFMWLYSIASLYAVAAAPSWLPTICLMCGVGINTFLVAYIFERVRLNHTHQQRESLNGLPRSELAGGS